MRVFLVPKLIFGITLISLSQYNIRTVAEELDAVTVNDSIDRWIQEQPQQTQLSQTLSPLAVELSVNPSVSSPQLDSDSTINQVSSLAKENYQIVPVQQVNRSQYSPQNPNTETLNHLQDYSREGKPKRRRRAQVTSVSQLSDVQPTDWAFQALQSLVERYGCIAGYPDGTYKGNRALTRYEFAAGVNACLERVNELIDAATADLVTREDLAKLQRLMEEFAAELAAIRGRVTVLEARTAELEANQFSTTTKLRGNAIFAVADVFGEDDTSQTVLQQRVGLNFISSFTGRDALLISIFEGNTPIAQVGGERLFSTGTFDLPGVEALGSVGGRPTLVRATTAEGTLSSQFSANTNGKFIPIIIAYAFPVTPRLQALVTSQFAPFQAYAPTLNPYMDDFDSGRGAISVFGEYNPIYALSGGGAGVILNYFLTDRIQLTGGYLADGLNAPEAGEGQGLFNGGYGVLGQVTWRVTDSFSIAGVYTNDYSPPGRFGFNYNALGVTGTAVANTLAGQDVLDRDFFFREGSPTITNAYGVNFSWQPSSRFALSGWFTTVYPRSIGNGDGNILTYALTFAFPDLVKEGDLLGFVVGAEPYLTEFNDGTPQPFEVDLPLHLEAFYRFQFSDNISVTPGFIVLTAPNQDRDNDARVIGTVRTTFQF